MGLSERNRQDVLCEYDILEHCLVRAAPDLYQEVSIWGTDSIL